MKISEAKKLGNDLINHHNLSGWQFVFDNSVRRFGRCSYRRKTISISKHLTRLNSEDKVKDTILHEIAHALIGPGFGHGLTWRDKALEIGCNGERCYDETVIVPKKKYIGTCKGCGKTVEAFRRRKIACKNCCVMYNEGMFSTKYLFKWRKNK